MAISRSKFLSSFTIIIFCVTFASSIHCLEEPPKRLFVFGDSLFDTGNNQYISDENDYVPGSLPPYGMTFFKKPTGRLSDGRLVPDFIAVNANLTLPTPFLEPGAVYTHGANFASAGSGALDIHEGAINLGNQVENFTKLATQMGQILGHDEAKEILNRAVYLFSMGGNDYLSFNTNNKDPTLSEQIEYVGQVMSKLINGIQEIYSQGGRKFGFQNVGPLGCMPVIKQMTGELEGDCLERFMRHARLHNNFLYTVLEEFEQDFPDFKYAIFDYYTAMRDRILQPTTYGFKVGKIACCGNGVLNGGNCSGGSEGVEFNLCPDPNKYVFFDGGHTSERTNTQLVQLMWDGPDNVTGPHYNVKNLFEL